MNKTRAMIATPVDDIKAGIAAAPFCDAATPRTCQGCGVTAVLPLNPTMRMAQPDATTHVCHPCLGGCNQGWTVYDTVGA